MFQYQTYQSPYAMAIANAVGGADRARAAAAGEQGQVAAQLAGNIGQIASGTMHDFLNYNLDKPRRDLIASQAAVEKVKATQVTQDQNDETAMRAALQASGGDHDAALQTLDARGAVGAATKLRTALSTERTRAIDAQTKLLDLSKKRLGQASQMLQGIPESDDPWTSYAEVLPKVREIVGPDLGKALPDDYDPDRVNQAIGWGQTAQELLERRRGALEAAREGVATAKDTRERDAYFTKSLAQWLPTVSDQGEWTQALDAAKKLGAAPETLAKFGDSYTPEAAKHAEVFGVTPEERMKAVDKGPKAGSIEDYMATYARDVAKVPVGAMTLPQKDAALKRYAQDHKVDAAGELTASKRADLVDTIVKYPSVYHDLTDTTKSAIAADLAKAGFTQFDRQATPATLAAAERWRTQQLSELDKRYKAAQALPEVNGAMSPENLQTAKDAIDASYRAQIGGGAATKKPAAAAPPAAAGAKPPAAAATPQSLLRGQKAGKYTLSDGSKWIVGKDGSIQPGQ